MELEANRGQAGPSPFSRPPQPKAAATFGSGVGAPRESPRPGPTGEARQALERRRRSGGQWFYWVAGLSLINAVLATAGQEWHFILGLGVTQIVQAMTKSGSGGTKAGLIGLAVIGLFVVLGQRAVQGYRWAFLLGMTLYALDGVIFLLAEDWLGAGFHVFALAMIARGYSAARRLPVPNA